MADSLIALAKAMTQHELETPDHGRNCACKDRWLTAARTLVRDLDPVEYANLEYLFYAAVAR